jgi:pyrroloquinoline quinone biosynthesis protein D
MTERAIIREQAKPRLAPHVRLKFDERRDQWVVLAPERLLMPDEIAMEVLHRCDGQNSIASMVDAFAATFDADREEITGDVLALVQELVDKGVLVP